jgi:tetratricopeptide (TPR) repeat protein
MDSAVADIERIEGADGTQAHYARACRLIWQARSGDKRSLAEARTRLAVVAARRPAWGRVALGQAQVEDLAGNGERAIGLYQRAIDVGERDPSVIQRLVQLLVPRQRYIEAEQAIRLLPESALQSGPFQRLAAEALLRTDNISRALELARTAVSKDSRDYRDHLWLGQVLWAANRPDEAEAALRHAVSLAETNPDAWVALVQHLARTGHKEKAEAALAEAGRKIPADQANLTLAQGHESLGRIKQAQTEYQAALSARPEDVTVLRALAGFHLRAGRPREAEPHLRKLITLSAQSREEADWARRLLALVLTSSGDYQRSREALALLGILDADAPPRRTEVDNATDVRLIAAVLAAQKGRRPRRQAIRLMEELAARQPPTADDRFFLAQLHQAVGDWPKARTLLLELLAGRPDNAQYLCTLALGLLRDGQPDAAEVWLAKLEKAEPDSFRTIGLKARALKARGNEAEASALIKKYSQTKDANLAQAAALLEDLALPAAEEIYRRLAAESKRPESCLLLAGYLGRRGRTGDALDVCQAARRTCPPDQVASTAVAILYAAKVDQAQCGRVEAWLEDDRRKHPNAVIFLDKLAALRSLQGRYSDALVLYRQVIERNRRNSGAMNNLAWLLAMRGEKSGEALDWIQQALEISGPLASLLDTRGVVNLALGRDAQAVQDLREAVSENPTATTYFHLARALLAVKDRQAAGQALRQAEAAGLKEQVLHPLERPAYKALLAQLKAAK